MVLPLLNPHTVTKAPTKPSHPAKLNTPHYLTDEQALEVAAGLNRLCATAIALWVKTKNYHWHMNGPHFRDYHLLLDEQAVQILTTVDPLAERSRKLGQTTVHSVGHVAKLQQIEDDNREFVSAEDMLHTLAEDNKAFTEAMLAVHGVCDEYSDVASASLLEEYMDQSERRTWFLFESTRTA